MHPRWHILFGFTFSVLLILFAKFSFLAASIVFLSSIFIDLDHYTRFIIKERKIHPKKFWEWSFKRKKEWDKTQNKEDYQAPLFILHGLEALFILAIFTIFNSLFIWILVGFSFHILLDLLQLIYLGETLHKISQIHVWQTNKKKKPFD